MEFDTQVKLAVYRHFAETGWRPSAPCGICTRIWESTREGETWQRR